MPSSTVQANQSAIVTVPAGSKITTYSAARYAVFDAKTYSNAPPQMVNSFNNTGGYTSSSYNAAGTVSIFAGAQAVLYAVGTSPVIVERSNVQASANSLNATGTLTAALILSGIVTSTTAAAVTATLDTGTTVDAAHPIDIGDGFQWSAINTGSNAFTVTAATGHTVVGAGAVAAGTSGRFMTVKSAAATFVTYRLS